MDLPADSEGVEAMGKPAHTADAAVLPQDASAKRELKNRLPIVVYFEGDVPARAALAGSTRLWRVPSGELHPHHRSPAVLLVSAEALLAERWYILRGDQRLRVIALSDERFHDPRLDGAVYAYLPRQTAGPLIERAVDAALSHIHLTEMYQAFTRQLVQASEEIDELNRIGTALSAERDVDKLLAMILRKSREITGADAGSLYLVEEGADGNMRRLRFALAENDSVSVPFRQVTMEISSRSIAGYVAMTGEIVAIDDAYHLLPGMPYAINRKFDEDSGYRTKSILAVPMRDQKGAVVGVVQLINAKRDFQAKLDSVSAVVSQVVPFTDRHRDLTASLASQAAVALENGRLYESIERLFEGFVRASVGAIEARDPTTSGHSFRVANLTLGLADAINRATDGPFAEISFTPDQMKEIRYASLLHDFGKVAVREQVLVKSRKLFPQQLEVIGHRFQIAKLALERAVLRSKGQSKLRKDAAELTAKLDAWWTFVQQADQPTVLPEGSFAVLEEIARYEYDDADGVRHRLLTAEEMHALSIRQGSLAPEEREQIESHVEHTHAFLRQIPWTEELRGIPEIAHLHHEKLNGTGYPRRIGADGIPLQTRMITLTDIFDGLTATDRPYKRAVSVEQALNILGGMAARGEIDRDLLELFERERVWEQRPARD